MNDENEFNPKGRRLCPDGTCVGLIGPNGRCQVCGIVGGPAIEGAPPEAEPESESLLEAPESPTEAAAPAGGDGGFDPKRRLCDDGSCVGVIGVDGRCNVCGKVSGS
jgi:hypothetical protein